MISSQNNQSIADVLRRQKAFFSTGETLTLESRMDSLERLESTLVSHKDEILAALKADLNKPSLEAYLAEYYFLLEEIRLVKKSLKRWLRPKRVSSPVYMQPCKSVVRNEPYGVVLIMAPWNYPIQLALAPLISAIAAGNTVVLKPSELATASEALLVKMLGDVFPPEMVCVQTGGVEASKALLQLKFDFIFFTGSTEVGKVVAKRAAEDLIPSVLELGGKCPCIVDATADIKLAASRILNGKFFNAGQTCFAPDFVAVEESVANALTDALIAELKSVPWHKEMANVINQKHYSRLLGLLEAVDAERVFSEGEDDVDELKLAPRIVQGCHWDEALLEHEIFGPILPVVSYQSESDLLEKLSGYGDPLAMYLFSEDDGFCQRMQNAKRSGGVCINDTMKQSMSLNLPFGGVGDSGLGRYRGVYGLEAFSYQRAVVQRGKFGAKWLDLKPPYSKIFPWIERFMR